MTEGAKDGCKAAGTAAAGAAAGACVYGIIGGIGLAIGGTAVGVTLGPFIAIGAGAGALLYGTFWLGKSTKISNTYFVFEDDVGETEPTAMIHLSSCSFCNNGEGIKGARDESKCRWHGPFPKKQDAISKAQGTGKKLKFCQKCCRGETL